MPPSKKLHVGNLPELCLSSELEELFESHGRVMEVVVIKDSYAFVVRISEYLL